MGWPRLALCVGVVFAGCNGASKVAGVACGGDGDCKVAGLVGTCESTGFCSYPDTACEGGRYSPGAGDGLGGTCVGGAAGCGSEGQACCMGVLCGADLVCVDADTATTCQCGAETQPCCGGATCGANLACNSEAVCACGGAGDPCCGGTTCAGGLTCNGGTCSSGVLEVAVSWGFACALLVDHRVSCWGQSWKPYPFGNPGLSVPILSYPTPQIVPGLSDVEDIHSAEASVCARKSDGTLWCWGHNENGQLGNGTNTSSATPTQVLGLSNVTLFDGGRYHMCAIGTVGGTNGLWCWGHNSTGTRRGTPNPNLGRLGTGDIADSNKPVRVDLSVAAGAGQMVRSLSTGGYHSCIAMSDNTVWCWGRGGSGELGNAASSDTKAPVAVALGGVTIPPGVTIDQVSCTDGNRNGSSCLRLSNGKVHCWGDGGVGQLGDGTSTSRNAPAAPVDTTALGGATLVELASASNAHCGRASDGTVWCWGENQNGLLGDGTSSNRATPQQTVGLVDAIQVAASHRDACAVDSNQQLFCWGNNRRFQATAGPSADTAVLVPTQVMP